MARPAGPVASAQVGAVAQSETFRGVRLGQLGSIDGAGFGQVVLADGLDAKLLGRAVAACGPVLCYADGEHIARPRRLPAYSLFLLVEGEAEEVGGTPWQADGSREARITTLSGRSIASERIAAHLARAIGPYAEVAVREAATLDPRPTAVKRAVAAEIDDIAAREAFLRDVLVDDDASYREGLVFGLQSGAYARMSAPALRAVRRAVVLPIRLEP